MLVKIPGKPDYVDATKVFSITVEQTEDKEGKPNEGPPQVFVNMDTFNESYVTFFPESQGDADGLATLIADTVNEALEDVARREFMG